MMLYVHRLIELSDPSVELIQIVDEGLVDDSIKAKHAARGLVEARQGYDDDILGDDFVHLDVGDRSPMVSQLS